VDQHPKKHHAGWHLTSLARGMRDAFADPQVRTLLVVTSTLVAVASVVYVWIEGCSYLDAIYFSVMTLATVGYGDLAPHTALGKLFTIFFALVGIGLFVVLCSSVAKQIIFRVTDDENE
jgi:voltage-gated potassium channel Kch